MSYEMQRDADKFGPEREADEIRTCEAQGVTVRALDSGAFEELWRKALRAPITAEDVGRFTESLRPVDIEQCPFEGEVLVSWWLDYLRGPARLVGEWTCPVCDTRHKDEL